MYSSFSWKIVIFGICAINKSRRFSNRSPNCYCNFSTNLLYINHFILLGAKVRGGGWNYPLPYIFSHQFTYCISFDDITAFSFDIFSWRLFHQGKTFLIKEYWGPSQLPICTNLLPTYQRIIQSIQFPTE